MSELLKLAERCEQATGPDRELDFAIAEASGFERDGSMFWRGGDCFVIERGYYDIEGSAPELPSFTASIDAAMTLVPEGWLYAYNDIGADGLPLATLFAPDVEHHHGIAKTQALCTTAAALRALAAQEPSS